MIDEQTKRAVGTMALCGCELEAVFNMLPQIAIIHVTIFFGSWSF